MHRKKTESPLKFGKQSNEVTQQTLKDTEISISKKSGHVWKDFTEGASIIV